MENAGNHCRKVVVHFGVRRINEVILYVEPGQYWDGWPFSAGLYHLGNVTSHPGQLSLTIPPWYSLGVMSTGDSFGHL